MKLCKWNELPLFMQCDEVKCYYQVLERKRLSLLFKRIFDVFMSLILLMILSPVFLVTAVVIKIDSKGPIFFRQTRITQYGKEFRIFKFRTMAYKEEESGSKVTVHNDNRITRVGAKLRECRLDEIPQLFNILKGEMSFVGTRPEVPQYVEAYSAKMYATLLLPAGVTSWASIKFKDEAELLVSSEDAEKVYLQEILPRKMEFNYQMIERFSIHNELYIMLNTISAVIK